MQADAKSEARALLLYGCFYKVGVLLEVVLAVRALVFGIYAKAPDFVETPVYPPCWPNTLQFLCDMPRNDIAIRMA